MNHAHRPTLRERHGERLKDERSVEDVRRQGAATWSAPASLSASPWRSASPDAEHLRPVHHREKDVGDARELTGGYVARESEKRPRVEPVAAAVGAEHGDNTESRFDRRPRRTSGARSKRAGSQCREGGSNSHTARAVTDFKWA